MSTEGKSLDQYLQEQKAVEREVLNVIKDYKEQRRLFIQDINRKKGIVRSNLILLALIVIHFSKSTLKASAEDLKERQEQKRTFLTDIRVESNLILKYTKNLFILADEIICYKTALDEIRNEIKGLESLIRGESHFVQEHEGYILQVLTPNERVEQVSGQFRWIEYIAREKRKTTSNKTIQSIVQEVLNMKNPFEADFLAEIETRDKDESTVEQDRLTEVEDPKENKSSIAKEDFPEVKAGFLIDEEPAKAENLNEPEILAKSRQSAEDKVLEAPSKLKSSPAMFHQNLIKVSLKEHQRIKLENSAKQKQPSLSSQEKSSSKSNGEKLWEFSEIFQTFHAGLASVFPFLARSLPQPSTKQSGVQHEDSPHSRFRSS